MAPVSSRPCRYPSCTSPLPRRHRSYCAEHSTLSAALWKRERRRLDRGSRYWLDAWINQSGSEDAARKAYNAYKREYMRRWRKKRAERSALQIEARISVAA